MGRLYARANRATTLERVMGMGGISLWQLAIILLIVVVIFGTKKVRSILAARSKDSAKRWVIPTKTITNSSLKS